MTVEHSPQFRADMEVAYTIAHKFTKQLLQENRSIAQIEMIALYAQALLLCALPKALRQVAIEQYGEALNEMIDMLNADDVST